MSGAYFRLLSTIARWLFILCLPLLLLSAAIAVAVNNPLLYSYGFNKYEISQSTGLEPAELDKAAAGLRDYFNSGDELISLTVLKDGQPFTLFNQREVTHLKDVKELFRLDYWLLAGASIYALGYAAVGFFKNQRRRLARAAVAGSGLTLALMLALGLGTLLGFDELFWQFHIISFSNDFWLLDPTKDYLVMLFPQGFWYDTTVFCALLTAAGAAALGGSAYYYLRKSG